MNYECNYNCAKSKPKLGFTYHFQQIFEKAG